MINELEMKEIIRFSPALFQNNIIIHIFNILKSCKQTTTTLSLHLRIFLKCQRLVISVVFLVVLCILNTEIQSEIHGQLLS